MTEREELLERFRMLTVGCTVYAVKDGEIFEFETMYSYLVGSTYFVACRSKNESFKNESFAYYEFGKIVFFTKDEAGKALAGKDELKPTIYYSAHGQSNAVGTNPILLRSLVITDLVGVIYSNGNRTSVTNIDEQLLKDIKVLEINGHKFKKETALKPTYEGDGYDENGEIIYDTAYCLNCNHVFKYEINDWGCDYCSDCGQKLDWSIEIDGEDDNG